MDSNPMSLECGDLRRCTPSASSPLHHATDANIIHRTDTFPPNSSATNCEPAKVQLPTLSTLRTSDQVAAKKEKSSDGSRIPPQHLSWLAAPASSHCRLAFLHWPFTQQVDDVRPGSNPSGSYRAQAVPPAHQQSIWTASRGETAMTFCPCSARATARAPSPPPTPSAERAPDRQAAITTEPPQRSLGYVCIDTRDYRSSANRADHVGRSRAFLLPDPRRSCRNPTNVSHARLDSHRSPLEIRRRRSERNTS
jgi:hypothetical protein